MDAPVLNVLLIEDNPGDAGLVRAYLSEGNPARIELEQVERLSEALGRLGGETRFDAVLLDLNLPDSTGLETFCTLHAKHPNVPIVVLTGMDVQELALQAVRAGAEDYLAKSWLQPHLLVRTICYAVERAQRRRADQKLHEALRESEHRYRRLLGAVTSYTYTVHCNNGKPVSTEHSEGCLTATGYSPEDYAADRYLWFSMVHPDDRDLVRQYVAGFFASDDVPPVQHRIIHKDGSTRWLRTTVVRHCDENGRPIRYDGLVEDITKRKQAELALREREAHLLVAQQIQQHLLPDAPPVLPGFDIAGGLYPAAFAAGDYFDYLPLHHGSIGFAIGDVSGHGFAPALVMATACAHLRSLAQTQTQSDIGEILTLVNHALTNEVREGRFVTMLLVALDLRTRSLVYANAGHPTGYVLDSSGAVKTYLESTALPLAILADAAFPVRGPVTLEAGDMVLLLTDGVLEARRAEGNLFGAERSLEVVRDHRDRSAAEIVSRLYHAVCRSSGRETPIDDVTALVIKVEG